MWEEDSVDGRMANMAWSLGKGLQLWIRLRSLWESSIIPSSGPMIWGGGAKGSNLTGGVLVFTN